MTRTVLLAVLALAAGGGCGPPPGDTGTVEIGREFAMGGTFTPLPDTGGTMELHRGLQGAVMFVPSFRVTGIDGFTAGRLEVRIIVDGSEMASENIPLSDLADAGDGSFYDYGEFSPMQDDQFATYFGHTATVNVTLTGGGFDAFDTVDVLMVDDVPDAF